MPMLTSEVMKQRSTTPVQRFFTAKPVLVAAAILMLAAVPFSIVPRVNANKYDDRITALQQQVDQYQAQADKLRQMGDTLANKLQQLASQIAAVQTQIQLSQAQYDTLQNQIKETEQKIKENQDALGATIADLYVDDSISPLEMLASSQNIGDYVDKQTYRSSVQDQLTQTIATIKALKAKLENDKKAVKEVLDKQTAQRNSLATIENEQQILLQKTRGEEAAYQQQVSGLKAEMAKEAELRRSYMQSLTSRGSGTSGIMGYGGGGGYQGLMPSGPFEFRNYSGNQGCSGGYPYCGAMDSYADPWALYNRECVSYSAWAASERFGKYVGSFAGRGNAYEWPITAARNSGATVDRTPEVGAVAILPPLANFSVIGHSMNVEAILGGGWVRVSQYNFGGTGEYSTMDIKASGVVFVHFKNK